MVTDPEIVEEAYAFDNPCFKDVTISSNNRNRETAISLTPGDTPGKDSTRWSTSWTSLGLGSTNRNDKRKTLDDSCLGVSFIFFFFLLSYDVIWKVYTKYLFVFVISLILKSFIKSNFCKYKGIIYFNLIYLIMYKIFLNKKI